MNFSQRELEDLLTKTDASSRLCLENWSNSLWPYARADWLALAMRNLARRRFFHRLMRGTLICINSLFLLALHADPLHPPPIAVAGFFVYLLIGILIEAVWRNIRLVAGERRAREWLVKMGDIRALPGLLRGIGRGKPRHEDAAALLDSATAGNFSPKMFLYEQRALCKTIRKHLAKFARRRNPDISEAEADLLIAMMRFLAGREMQASQPVLRRVATRTSQYANAAFVSEAAQSLLDKETLSNSPAGKQSPANVSRVGIR